jgi:multiple sugar transport system substrate-binding protein
MRLKHIACAAALLLPAGTLAACGGGDDNGGSGGSDSSMSRGPITYVQGKDNSNVVRPLIAKWNKAHPDEKVTFVEQSDEADQQHNDLVQHFQAQESDYDVVDVDVVWTAEFAAKGWLEPLTGDLALPTDTLLPAAVATATYNNTLYAAPQSTDGGILYYRKDLVPNPPTTWDEMMQDCSIADQNNIGCYAGQFAKYEGLTVNASEAIDSWGGSIVGDDGVTPTVDSPEAAEGLGNLVDAYKNGNIPKEAITYTEEEGRLAFESGKLLFLRNWPYVYALATTDGSSKVKGKFGMSPLPGKDGPGASSLGGHNAAISVYCDHKLTAYDFLKFIETEETQKFYITQGSLAPVISSLYDDPTLVKNYPYLPVLKTSLENAVPRPVSPYYPAVTLAIQDNAYEALKGTTSVEDALKSMSDAIAAASEGS